MWETIRGYLTFNRKERFGVLFLLLLMVVLFVLPYFFRPAAGSPDTAAYESMKQGIQKFESGDSTGQKKRQQYQSVQSSSNGEQRYQNKAASAELFIFDPNTISGEQWQRLGLSERLSQTIRHYVDKGGRFRRAEDLRKLYGLHADDYDRLLPYVRIGPPAAPVRAHTGYYSKAITISGLKKADSFYKARSPGFSGDNGLMYSAKKYRMTDVNAADSAAWALLPGIGEKLASRIVHFRGMLGGFMQPDQVGETFGLADSTFQKIKPWLTLRGASPDQIDLNHASKETLQLHPYIRWKLAKLITDYREQHGMFHSVDELLQLAEINAARFEKIKPYVIVK